MTAGPDEVRKLGPYQVVGLLCPLAIPWGVPAAATKIIVTSIALATPIGCVSTP
ncbi:hypothetical protein RKLH11_3946 [Rhodobacteraceae bacterium KLH11]|nr:hypothetical protein RKLH11_3946 [Rhodobacteraceae bacterium KLH11]